MNLPFLDLLKQIAGGIVIYEPFSRDSEGLNEFQDTVHRLQEMERSDWWDGCLSRSAQTAAQSTLIL